MTRPISGSPPPGAASHGGQSSTSDPNRTHSTPLPQAPVQSVGSPSGGSPRPRQGVLSGSPSSSSPSSASPLVNPKVDPLHSLLIAAQINDSNVHSEDALQDAESLFMPSGASGLQGSPSALASLHIEEEVPAQSPEQLPSTALRGSSWNDLLSAADTAIQQLQEVASDAAARRQPSFRDTAQPSADTSVRDAAPGEQAGASSSKSRPRRRPLAPGVFLRPWDILKGKMDLHADLPSVEINMRPPASAGGTGPSAQAPVRSSWHFSANGFLSSP